MIVDDEEKRKRREEFTEYDDFKKGVSEMFLMSEESVI